MPALLKHSILYRIFDHIRTQRRYRQDYRLWISGGRPAPAPHLAKQLMIKQYATRFRIGAFIETGTYLGEMVQAVHKSFHRVYSVELSPELYERAKQRFAGREHISLICGDSARVIGELLGHVTEPCLFWLDGHFSGGITALGDAPTPILRELGAILTHRIEGHVILIDDARMFTGEHGWPRLAELQALIQSKRSHWEFEVKDDVIRAHAPINLDRR